MSATTTNSVIDIRDTLINASTSKSSKDAHRNCTNHFLTFAVKQLKCGSTHPSLLDTIRKNTLHPDFITDDIMSRFLAYMFDNIKSRSIKLKCNIRPVHSWLSVSCGAAGKDIKLFGKCKATWSGIQKHYDYITDDPEQCTPLTEDDIDKINNMSPFDEDGNIDPEVIGRKHLCQVKLSGSIRGLNAYELPHGTVYISQGFINNQQYDKPIICVCVPLAFLFFVYSVSPVFVLVLIQKPSAKTLYSTKHGNKNIKLGKYYTVHNVLVMVFTQVLIIHVLLQIAEHIKI